MPTLGLGMRTEINLAARDWIAGAGQRLVRGFVLLVDYGETASALRSPATARRNAPRVQPAPRVRSMDRRPGEQDLTTHVDFTALERWASRAGLELAGRIDQSRFLIGLGAIERLQRAEAGLPAAAALRRRLGAEDAPGPGWTSGCHSQPHWFSARM